MTSLRVTVEGTSPEASPVIDQDDQDEEAARAVPPRGDENSWRSKSCGTSSHKSRNNSNKDIHSSNHGGSSSIINEDHDGASKKTPDAKTNANPAATVAAIVASLSRPDETTVARIRAWLQACPTAARTRDPDTRRLLLHSVCQCDALRSRARDATVDVAMTVTTALDVLQVIVDAWPEAVQQATGDADGALLPLHLACRHGLPLACVRWLTQRYPSALQRYSGRGWLPIHYACAGCASAGTVPRPSGDTRNRALVVHSLVRAAPTTLQARTKTSLGQLPLHLLCQYGSISNNEDDANNNLQLMAGLLTVWPDSLYHADNQGRLPIHYLCAGGSSILLEYMMMQDAEFLHTRARDAQGNLPLHILCANPKATLELVQDMVQACPEAAWQRNQAGESPADVSVNLDVMQMLEDQMLQHNQGRTDESVARPKRLRSGQFAGTSLHQVCADKTVTVGAIENIVMENPDEVCQGDAEGMLPLHVALRAGASLSVVEYLVHDWPAALQWMNSGGSLPLHTACSNPSIQVDTVRFLITAWPKATHVANHYGWLPLHCAAFHGVTSTDVFGVLLKSNVNAMTTLAFHTQETPLHLACGSLTPSFQVVFALLDQEEHANQDRDLVETILAQGNAGGDLPLHKAIRNRTAPLEVIQYLVDQYPAALHVSNSRGDSPLTLAERRSDNRAIVDWLTKASSTNK